MQKYITSEISALNSSSLSKKNTGLGNTLFQFASVYGLSKRLNMLCTFPNIYILSCKLHDFFNLNYRDTIFQSIPMDTNVTFSHRVSEQNAFNFDNTLLSKISNINANVMISGYLQNCLYFCEYQKEISSIILKGLENHIKQVHYDFNNINWEKSCFLHVRRGDYVQKKHIHFLMDSAYYQEAIKKFPDVENIFLFSDDVEYLKDYIFFSSDKRFHIIESEDELYTLSFMTLCKGGAICANSTFSWWGAFLGAHSTKSLVIIPDKWIDKSVGDPSGLLLEGWIKL